MGGSKFYEGCFVNFLQKYFLNKVDGRYVGALPESSLGFSLIFLEKTLITFKLNPDSTHRNPITSEIMKSTRHGKNIFKNLTLLHQLVFDNTKHPPQRPWS